MGDACTNRSRKRKTFDLLLCRCKGPFRAFRDWQKGVSISDFLKRCRSLLQWVGVGFLGRGFGTKGFGGFGCEFWVKNSFGLCSYSDMYVMHTCKRICTYVCMYVPIDFTYVRTYVRTYVCMYACMRTLFFHLYDYVSHTYFFACSLQPTRSAQGNPRVWAPGHPKP